MVQIVRRTGFTRVEYGLRNVFPQGFPPFLLKILSRSQGRDLRSLAWQPQWSPPDYVMYGCRQARKEFLSECLQLVLDPQDTLCLRDNTLHLD